jgi:hypothetical protein
MKKYTYLFLFCCLMLAPGMFANAQTLSGQDIGSNPITTAVPFLTIAPDSRHGAMGDVGVSTSSDVNSQHWNSSKYVFMENSAGFGISYTPWLRNLADDINLAYVSGYYKLDDIQSISSSLRYFSLGDIQLADGQGYNMGVQNPNEFAFDAGYSRKLSDKWAGGVVVRYIRSDLSGGTGSETYTAGNAFATDISFFYNNSWLSKGNRSSIAAGIDISNVGSKISYDDGETKEYLPANLRLGTSYTMDINEYNSFALSFDINKLLVPTPADTFSVQSDEGTSIIIPRYSTEKAVISSLFSSFTDAPGGFQEELQELMFSLGAEYWYNKQFALRGGYFYEHENKGNRKYVTFGAGLKMNVFGLDFSYLMPISRSNPLQNTLRFTLSFDLDSNPLRGSGF